jgi:N-acetylglucosamine kinase-like BadF-type ATPase
MRILAVDAGQTGIRTLLIESGIPRAQAEHPGILTSEPLIPQLARVVLDAVEGPVDVVAVGSTGLTAEETDPGALRARVGARQVLMAHDSVTSYLGALGQEPGGVVAAGTGVVTLAVGATDVARVDGWGNLIGDAGSGYWIGRAALEAVMRAHDGRGPSTALSAVVRDDFPDLEQAYIELQGDPGRVRRIAAYTRAVAELSDEGDPVAQGICADAAGELAWSVETGLQRVGQADRPDPVVCGMGGVLRADAITRLFTALLRRRWDQVDIRSPRGPGIDGAAILPEIAPGSALYRLIARG